MTVQLLQLDLETGQILKFSGKFAKVSNVDKRHIIAGYASVEVVDKEGQIIKVPALKRALDKFMADKKYRNVHVVHSNVEVGKVIDEEIIDSEGKHHQTHVDEIGLYAVCEIDRDITATERVWDAIEKGELRSFSIGGEAFQVVPEGDHEAIIDLELHEITLCPEGMNQPAKFQVIKAQPIKKEDASEYLHNMPDGAVLVKMSNGLVLALNRSEVRKDETGAQASVSSGKRGGSGSGKMSDEDNNDKNDPKKGNDDSKVDIKAVLQKVLEDLSVLNPEKKEDKKKDGKKQDGEQKEDDEKQGEDGASAMDLELKSLLEKLLAHLERMRGASTETPSKPGEASKEGEDDEGGEGEGQKGDDDESDEKLLGKDSDGKDPLKNLPPDELVKTITAEVLKGLKVAYPAVKKSKVPKDGKPGTDSDELSDADLAKMPFDEVTYHVESHRQPTLAGGT